MPKVKKARKLKAKKRTLAEFKHWINGLSEFRDEGWHPDFTQWNHIQDSINSIIEEEYVYEEEQFPHPSIAVPYSTQTTVTVPTSLVSPEAQYNQTDIESRLSQDIDTSDGNYVSEFE